MCSEKYTHNLLELMPVYSIKSPYSELNLISNLDNSSLRLFGFLFKKSSIVNVSCQGIVNSYSYIQITSNKTKLIKNASVRLQTAA